jgi:PAS domain S-box-containing protein/putative nucleotidyltransferase with HDIG domain
MSWRVLCVDDTPSNLFTYESILSRIKEIKSICVQSGKEALDELLKNKIDLILLDIQMPQMDGYEVARLIKSNNATKNIPIIFITAVFKKEEFIAKGFRVGAVDYLTKPLDDNLLLNRIRLYLDIFTQRDLAQENMQRFYEISQNVGDGLYVLDCSLKVTFINTTALRMLGYHKSELLGESMHTLTHYRDRDGNFRGSDACDVHSVLKSGEVVVVEDDVFVKKDGSSLPVALVATPIVQQQKVTGVVVLFKDIRKQKRLLELEKEKLKSEKEMLLTLVDMINKRDTYTAGHTVRVASYCERIAKELGYASDEIKQLSMAAQLHDIGKVATPDSILLKPGRLNADEYEIIKLHLIDGYELLSKLSQYKEIAQLMRYHHERFDGQGYPEGLRGEEIPALARIMIVADAFDAMTTNRIYKAKKSVSEALEEIASLSAIQFHPEVVEASMVALRDVKIEESLDQLPKNHIEESRYAYYYKDRLTDLFTLEYLPILVANHNKTEQLYCYKVELHNFHQFNLKYSWSKGDEVLISYAQSLKEHYKDAEIFRIEGDDFLIVSPYSFDMSLMQKELRLLMHSDMIEIDVTVKEVEEYLS